MIGSIVAGYFLLNVAVVDSLFIQNGMLDKGYTAFMLIYRLSAVVLAVALLKVIV